MKCLILFLLPALCLANPLSWPNPFVKPGEMPKIKLTYFDIRGRAEPLRLMFSYAGIKFEDERIKFVEWPIVKKLTPFGQLPLLKVNDIVLAESWTIYRYVANHLRLDGNSDWDRVYIDQIVELFRDWYEPAFNYLGVEGKLRPGNATFLYETQYKPIAKFILPLVEKQLDKEHGFIGHSGLSYVDFIVADFIDYNKHHMEVIGVYPKLIAHSKRVLALPQIQDYLKHRKSDK